MFFHIGADHKMEAEKSEGLLRSLSVRVPGGWEISEKGVNNITLKYGILGDQTHLILGSSARRPPSSRPLFSYKKKGLRNR